MPIPKEFVIEAGNVLTKINPEVRNKREFAHLQECDTCILAFQRFWNEKMEKAYAEAVQSINFEELFQQIKRHSDLDDP